MFSNFGGTFAIEHMISFQYRNLKFQIFNIFAVDILSSHEIQGFEIFMDHSVTSDNTFFSVSYNSSFTSFKFLRTK